MKMKTKNSSHRYDLNRPRASHGDKYNNNRKRVSVWWCLCVLSKTLATFEIQFIEKLSNTETELKKGVAYKKNVKRIG